MRGRNARTVGSALGSLAFAATTSHADAVDDVSLLGLVSETAGLVGARGARGAVDDIELAKLQSKYPQQSSTGNNEGEFEEERGHLKERWPFSVFLGIIVPPSSAHGEGSGGYRSASSFEVPRRT